MVTTLDERDLAHAIALLQLQHTIRLGIMATNRPDTPASSAAVVEQIEARWISRERDLRALMQVKNVADKTPLPDQQRALLADLTSVDGDPHEQILRFHQATQRELLRLLRVIGDDASDQDLRDFAIRNRPATVSTIELLSRSNDAR